MKAPARHAIVTAGVLLGCLPAAFVATFILLPLWSFIEDRYGIESVGHSGPAEWCFYATYGVLVAAGLAGYALSARRRTLR